MRFLVMMNDFYLIPGHFGYYVLRHWILFTAGVILPPNQLALSGDFLGVRVWGQGGHHWCLVSKGLECLLLYTQH